jgi:hypothetical protein
MSPFGASSQKALNDSNHFLAYFFLTKHQHQNSTAKPDTFQADRTKSLKKKGGERFFGYS